MKVILLQDVQNVGKQYEVKEVKDGYARNFLLAKDLAKAATKQNLQWLKDQREVLEKKAEEDLKLSQGVASRLDGLEVTIVMKVGDEGQLFESVSAAKVSEKLKELGFEIKKSQINLKDPLREIGEFPVKIALDHNLEIEITLCIVADKEVEKEI